MKSYSQVHQDLFVVAATQGKRGGVYLEIGAFHPENISNTVLLEREYGWKGVSVDVVDTYADEWLETRANPLVIVDATRMTMEDLGEIPLEIDYLSVDCEPAEQTLRALGRVFELGFDPKIVTFEHELYCEGDVVRNAARELMAERGYRLVMGDVGGFEDWYMKG